MTLAEFYEWCRRDFIEAGPSLHYQCGENHLTGVKGETRCVQARATQSEFAAFKRDGFEIHDMLGRFDEAWEYANGESSLTTNERGFAEVVAGYDRLILAMNPTPTTTPTTKQKELV